MQMGLSFSLPYTNMTDLDDHIESLISKSLSFKETNVRTVLRSFSFDDCRSSKLTKMRSFSSNRMIRGSVSFNERVESKTHESEPNSRTLISPLPEPKSKTVETLVCELKTDGPESPSAKPIMNRDLAAIKLQKTYKSFRTRRQLADCAVMVEQSWLVLFIVCMNSFFHHLVSLLFRGGTWVGWVMGQNGFTFWYRASQIDPKHFLSKYIFINNYRVKQSMITKKISYFNESFFFHIIK